MNDRLMCTGHPLLIALIIAAMLAACGDPSPSGESPGESEPAEMMAAALLHLITEDHTFGDGPPPFSEYLIEDRTVDTSAVLSPEDGNEDVAAESRPLTEQERAAVEETISAYGPVQWISDPDKWRTDDLEPEIEGSVIIGVGIPLLDGDEALVPVALWCGGACGTWLTYRLELGGDAKWKVTGTEGPIAIS